jgi:hypothetical protein
MYDYDVIELCDYNFNHYIHHFDEYQNYHQDEETYDRPTYVNDSIYWDEKEL